METARHFRRRVSASFKEFPRAIIKSSARVITLGLVGWRALGKSRFHPGRISSAPQRAFNEGTLDRAARARRDFASILSVSSPMAGQPADRRLERMTREGWDEGAGRKEAASRRRTRLATLVAAGNERHPWNTPGCIYKNVIFSR